jgi:hypothetical protein
METPSTPPSPKSEKVARITGVAEKVKKWVSVIAIIVVAMIYFGHKLQMGTRYKVSDKESVNYSEKATEAEAKKLGDLLKTAGYFDGTKEVDVLLKKDEKEGTVVSFVIGGLGKDATIETAFKQIGEAIAADGFGKPLMIRLVDTHLNTLKDIKVE